MSAMEMILPQMTLPTPSGVNLWDKIGQVTQVIRKGYSILQSQILDIFEVFHVALRIEWYCEV